MTDPLAGLDSGAIAVVPGFTGRLLDTFAPGMKARAPVQVYRAMVSSLPEGVTAGDYTESAEDKPALAVTEATADAWGGRDVTGGRPQLRPAHARAGCGCACTGERSVRARRRPANSPTAQRYSPRYGLDR